MSEFDFDETGKGVGPLAFVGALQSEKLFFAAAIEGDTAALQNLLLVTSAAIRGGTPLPPLPAEFVARALERIAYGANVKKAFGHNIKPTLKTRQRDRRLAYETQLLMNEGMKLADACCSVADSKSETEDVVKNAWRSFHKDMKSIIDIENIVRCKK